MGVSPVKTAPALAICAIILAELFQSNRPDIPCVDATAFRKAIGEDTTKQGKLL